MPLRQAIAMSEMSTIKAEPTFRPTWLDTFPYRALVPDGESVHGTPLYWVAGSELKPRKALSALKEALRLHGGDCFYCPASASSVSAHFEIDHVEASSRGGTDLLFNLVVACKDCNGKKSALPVEAFDPQAGRQWLLAAQALIRARLALICE
jgi:hypothetical protein